jgi:predicted nucleotidyltransferase
VFTSSPLKHPEAEVRQLDAKASAVIHTLAYFSIFRHPLRQEELAQYLHFCHAPVNDLSATLSNLVEMEMIGHLKGYYFLAGQQQIVGVRIERNQRAELWIGKIDRSVHAMHNLPFVEALALTGSLSKGTQDTDGDIDFLVLTRPGRLWTCHFFQMVILKLIPETARKLLCGNLILAADNLSIRTKNLFTATEIVTLRPLTNSSLWQNFYRENAWVSHFYPECLPPKNAAPDELATPLLTRFLERILAGGIGDWFEGTLFRLMMRRKRRKEEAKSHGDPLQRRWLAPSEIGHSQKRQKQWRWAWESALEKFEKRNSARLVHWQWELDSRLEGLGAIRYARGPSRSLFPLVNSAASGRT